MPSPTGPATVASTWSTPSSTGDVPVDQVGARRPGRPVRAGATSSWCSSATTTLTWLSLRNAAAVHIVAVDQLNTYDVLVSDDVVFTKGAYDAFVAGRAPTVARQRHRGRHRPEHDRAEEDKVSTLTRTTATSCRAGRVARRATACSTPTSTRSWCARTPTRPRSRSRSRRCSTSRSPSVNTLNRTGKTRRTRNGLGQAQRHQARHRQPGRGPPHRHLRRSGLLTGQKHED